jgi:hypothetical protein
MLYSNQSLRCAENDALKGGELQQLSNAISARRNTNYILPVLLLPEMPSYRKCCGKVADNQTLYFWSV